MQAELQKMCSDIWILFQGLHKQGALAKASWNEGARGVCQNQEICDRQCRESVGLETGLFFGGLLWETAIEQLPILVYLENAILTWAGGGRPACLHSLLTDLGGSSNLLCGRGMNAPW